METQKVDMFLANMNGNFPQEKAVEIREALLKADDSKFVMVQGLAFKNPIVGLVLDGFLGCLGAEYFYIGKTGLGVAKLLTCGGAGIWSLINLFTIMKSVREYNYNKLMEVL